VLGRPEVESLLISQLCALHLKIHFFAPSIHPLFLLPLVFPFKFPTAPMKSFDVSTIPDLPGKVTFVTGGPAEFFHSPQWLTRLRDCWAGQKLHCGPVKTQPGPHLLFRPQPNAASRLIEEIKGSAPDVELTFVPCDLASFASID
jgi:hypothetical protein